MGEKETHDPRPADLLRGRECCVENASRAVVPPLSLHRQTSGNAGDTDTQLRGSEHGIAVEPILPTPAVMRSDGTRWTRRRQKLWLCLNQGKDLNILPARVGSSRCDEALDQAHSPNIHESRIGPSRIGFRGSRHRRRGRQETAQPTFAPGAIPFGRLSPGIVLSLALGFQSVW